MKRLGWIVSQKKTADRSSGVLVLLLIMVVVYMLGSAFPRMDSNKIRCNDTRYIQIDGDISCPGVFPLCEIGDVKRFIEIRLGFHNHGCLDPIGTNTIVQSGLKISIRRGEGECSVHKGEMSAFYKYTLGIPISLNNESEEGLTSIPGIGPHLAKAIIQERAKRGGFRNLNELRCIRGVGSGLLKRIDPFITF
jgi:competence ComEA-like helix-hairpin-helix protein